MKPTVRVKDVSVDLERGPFLRSLFHDLSGAFDDVVGFAEASGYISIVGGAIGERIDADYRRALSVDRLTHKQFRGVRVDLKRRTLGDFYVIEETEDRIVFGNRACPFGSLVAGRPSLCMMTSYVFDFITAQNLAFGRLEIEEAIAVGHAFKGNPPIAMENTYSHPEHPEHPRRLRVLIVEDEAIVAMDLEMLLEELEAEVIGIAMSAAEADVLVAVQQPDVVTMDVNIKGDRDGVNAAQGIFQKHGIRSIFISAYSELAMRQRAEQCDALGWIEKPVHKAALADALDRVRRNAD